VNRGVRPFASPWSFLFCVSAFLRFSTLPAMANVFGLVPYLPPGRPRADARWWWASGSLEPSRLVVGRLAEGDAPPAVTALCGIAAPCSLPPAFLDFLGIRRSLDVAGPPDRIFRRAREFAAAAVRGQRQPLRVAHESLPALDRRRLPLFLAALPLLKGEAAPLVFEVDPPAILQALGLPHAGLSGASPESVDRRVHILAALAEGAFGFRVEVEERDYAVASLPALAALVACAMAARVHASGESRPPDAETWVPLP